jgi:hypothetical protein
MRIGSPQVLGSMLVLCAALAACSSDRAAAPRGTVLTDARVSIDVAANAGTAIAGELQDQSDYVADAGVAPASNQAPATGQASNHSAPVCTLDPATTRWNCAPFVNANGLTVTRSFAYFDARGAAMAHYDATTTARIDYRTEAHGPVGDGAKVYGITHRTSAQTASGLLGAETTRVWDGVGVSADTVTYRDSTGSRHYAGVRVDTLRALTWPQPRQRGAFPLSGQTIQVANFTVTSQPSNETRSVTRRVVTTYNGTATATIDVGHVTCLLHLDTHTVDGCH